MPWRRFPIKVVSRLLRASTRSVDAPPTYEVLIYLSADNHIASVVEMLEVGGSLIYNTETGTEHYRPYVYAKVPVSLFLGIEADERIKLVEHGQELVHDDLPSSPSSQSLPAQIQDWHDAGHTARRARALAHRQHLQPDARSRR